MIVLGTGRAINKTALINHKRAFIFQQLNFESIGHASFTISPSQPYNLNRMNHRAKLSSRSQCNRDEETSHRS